MDNKITGAVNEYLKAYRSQQVNRPDKADKGKNTKASGEQNKSGAPDSLELSGVAKKLKTGDIGEVRTEKVNQIKEQINQGNYTIDSGKIAEKMIEEAGLDIRV